MEIRYNHKNLDKSDSNYEILIVRFGGIVIKLRTSKFIVLNSILLLMALFPFQNCSNQMHAKTQLTSNLSSLSAVSSVIEIVFSDKTLLFSTPSLTTAFMVKGLDASAIQSIRCQLGSNPIQDCRNQSIQFSNLSDGDYSLKVIVVSTTGVTSEAVKTFQIDATPPVVMVSQAPPALTNAISATFSFASADNLSGVLSTECSLNGGAYVDCVSPKVLTSLQTGSNNFKIRSLDRAGNISLVYSYNWTVDLSVPTVQLSSMLPGITSSAAASFNFSGAGIVSYECQLDSTVYGACLSPKVYSGLLSANHSFKVRGRNASGVLSAAVIYNWTVDTMAPTTPNLTSSFSSVGNSKSGSFIFSSTDALSGVKEFQCSLDGSPFTVCTSPNAVTVTDGSHTFKVRAYDLAANASVESNFSFTVDSVLPLMSFTQTPASSTIETSAQFSFSSSDAGSGILSIQCSLDSASYTACISPRSLTNLTPATHQLSVQTKDMAGNIATLKYSWTVTAVATPPPATNTMKSIFIGSGHVGRTVMSCDDGLSWINDRFDVGAVTGDHSASASRGIDAGNGYIYANYGWGYNGTVRRSQDGINWTVIHDGTWGGGIAYGKDYLFHGAEGGKWYTSNNNGTSWVQLISADIGNINNQFDHPSITRLNNKIFVSGRNQKLGISYDQGRTWKLITAGLLGNTEKRTFAEGNGVIVSFSYDYAINEGNVSRSTDNGQTWTGFMLGGSWTQIVFNGSQFVGWSRGQTWKSSDGLTWTSTPTKIDGINAPSWWTATTQYNPKTGTYVGILNAYGNEYDKQKAYRSKDGINWTTLDSTKFKGGSTMKSMIVGEIDQKYCP